MDDDFIRKRSRRGRSLSLFAYCSLKRRHLVWLQCAHKRSLKWMAINNHLSTIGCRPLSSSSKRKADVFSVKSSSLSLSFYLFLKNSTVKGKLSFFENDITWLSNDIIPWLKKNSHRSFQINICHRLKERRGRRHRGRINCALCQIIRVLLVPYQDIKWHNPFI